MNLEKADKSISTNVPHKATFDNIPLGWVAQPENQADAIAFLASKQADHITGAALNIDGGHVMAPLLIRSEKLHSTFPEIADNFIQPHCSQCLR